MKTFRINKEYQIVCDWKKTRNGFKHTAELRSGVFKGNNCCYFSTIEKTKVCYLNRTWESFEYETVIKKLLSFNTNLICKGTQTKFLNKISGNYHKEVKSQFNSISMVAAMGNILCNNQIESNDWKKRILTAGLEKKGLIMPDDWNTLTEDDKEKRLNNVIESLAK